MPQLANKALKIANLKEFLSHADIGNDETQIIASEDAYAFSVQDEQQAQELAASLVDTFGIKLEGEIPKIDLFSLLSLYISKEL